MHSIVLDASASHSVSSYIVIALLHHASHDVYRQVWTGCSLVTAGFLYDKYTSIA